MGMTTRRHRRACAVLLLASGMLVGCSGSSGKPAAPSPGSSQGMGVVTTPNLSHDHVAAPVSYAQSPPVGGKHWPPQTNGVYGWQACTVYSEPVVNEFAVHSLEHGAVWLTYQPGASPAVISALSTLAQIHPAYVLVSPYPGQTSPVAATAWGLQLAVTDPTDTRLADFTRSYAGGGQGGELGADCARGATLPQARALLAAAR